MSRLRSILLVEDDQVDAMTVRRAFQGRDTAVRIVHMLDGETALAHLQSDRHEHPDLILLDLNMPRMSGIEFLRAIKSDSSLNIIPVIVLTTSDDAHDVLESFSSSIAGYMTKSVEFEEFQAKIKTVEDYWLINRLPGKGVEVF